MRKKLLASLVALTLLATCAPLARAQEVSGVAYCNAEGIWLELRKHGFRS